MRLLSNITSCPGRTLEGSNSRSNLCNAIGIPLDTVNNATEKVQRSGLRILMDCAQAEGELVTAGELSRRLDITLQNTFKITLMLSKEGFLETTRGAKGGVRLAIPPEQIRIGDVVRRMETIAVQVEEDSARRTKRGKVGSAEINRILDKASEAFISSLDRHTIKEMARQETPRMTAAENAKKSKKRASPD